ncbi:hypothetical protein HKX48_000611 [Thoreauomyces humboldtii]|nr:hypothetical protein HKX48_000611 [Thoreauomyces humboldtii]
MIGSSSPNTSAAASSRNSMLDTDLIMRLHQFAYNPSVHQPNPYVNVGKLNLAPYLLDMFGVNAFTPDTCGMVSTFSDPNRSSLPSQQSSPARVPPSTWVTTTTSKPSLSMPLFAQADKSTTVREPLAEQTLLLARDSSETPPVLPSPVAPSPNRELFASEEPHPIPLQFLSVFPEDEEADIATYVKPQPYRLRRDRRKSAVKEPTPAESSLDDDERSLCDFSLQHDALSSPIFLEPTTYLSDSRTSLSPSLDDEHPQEGEDPSLPNILNVHIDGFSAASTPLAIRMTRSQTTLSAPGDLPTPLTAPTCSKRKRLLTPETPIGQYHHFLDNFKENIPPSTLRRVQSDTAALRYHDRDEDDDAPAVIALRTVVESGPPAKRSQASFSSGHEASISGLDSDIDTRPQWQKASFTQPDPPPFIKSTSSPSFPSTSTIITISRKPGHVESVIPFFHRTASTTVIHPVTFNTLRRTKSHYDTDHRRDMMTHTGHRKTG